MLRDTRIDIHQRTSAGMGTRLPEGSRSRIEYLSVQIDGAAAIVTTCEVDDTVVYRTVDGSIVNDDVATARWQVSMVLEDGTWKVAGRHETKKWSGEEMAQCRDDV